MQRRLRVLTWDDFDKAVEQLSCLIYSLAIPSDVPLYGEPRGGLCLAVALSHRTSRPMVSEPQDGMIWVDDIIDSGKTLQAIMDRYTSVYPFAWAGNKTINNRSHFYLDKHGDDWLVFPWESISKAKEDRDSYVARQ